MMLRPKPRSRIKEPSSWAGFAILLSLFGYTIPIETIEIVVQSAAAVAAAVAIAIREKE